MAIEDGWELFINCGFAANVAIKKIIITPNATCLRIGFRKIFILNQKALKIKLLHLTMIVSTSTLPMNLVTRLVKTLL